MLIASVSTRVTRRQGVMGQVCARREHDCWANFAGKGIVAGTKRQPRPTTYEGKAPDS